MSQWRRLEPAVEAPSTSNILSHYLFLPRFSTASWRHGTCR